MDDDETEHELTVDEKRENLGVAEGAVIAIKQMTANFHVAIGDIVRELEKDTEQDICDEWMMDLDSFDGNLGAKILEQFNC